jgi:hypothetical protein
MELVPEETVLASLNERAEPPLSTARGNGLKKKRMSEKSSDLNRVRHVRYGLENHTFERGM